MNRPRHSGITRRSALALIGGSLVATLAVDSGRARSAATGDEWTQLRYDAGQTGTNEQAPGPDTDSPLGVAWRYEDLTSAVTPVVAETTVYVPRSEHVVALDRDTGERQWQTVVGEAILPIAVADGTVCAIEFESGSVTGLSADTGDRLWTEYPDSRPGTRPLVYNEQLVFGTTAGVRAVDTATGTTQWDTSLEGALTAPVSAANGSVFATTSTTMYRLDATGGDVEWAEEFLVASSHYPVVSEGTIITAGVDERPGEPELVAIRSTDGTSRWRVDRYDELTNPAVTDDRIYVGCEISGTPALVSIEPNDGSEAWRVLLESPLAAPPTAGMSSVYVTLENGTFLALNPEHGGRQLEWTVAAHGSPGQPVVVDESVFVSSAESGLISLQTTSDESSDPQQSEGSGPPDDEVSNDSAESPSDSADDDGFGPGLGVAGGLAGLAGAAYYWIRRKD